MSVKKPFARQTLAYPDRIEPRMVRFPLISQPSGRAHFGWRPPTNVFETDAGVVVQVEVAGLEGGDYRVDFGDGRLVVSGVRRAPNLLTSCRSCQQVEIAGGRFRTEVDVPSAVDDDRIQADYRDGFLFVTLPRRRA